jgi:hypothetical protein
MSKPKLTLEEHLELGPKINMIRRELFDLYFLCANKFGTSHPVSKLCSQTDKKFDLLRSVLDGEYHRVATDEDFLKHGHIYYGGKKGTQNEDNN